MPTGAEQAAHLMQTLGLTEDELCQILAVGPLEVLSDQIEHRSELPILVDLIDHVGETVSPTVLARWVRSPGLHGRPIEALLARDFSRFEDALSDLAERGFVMRSGSD